MSLAPFAGQKYLNLETFKKNGTSVKTPVWFAADPSASLDSNEAKLYVYTIGVPESETHSQQPARENRAVRHARQSAWRMGRSSC